MTDRGPAREHETGPAPPDALLDDPLRRDAYVAEIFDLIAPRYDRFTRWFSYGMDAGWKREVLRHVAEALREAPVSRPDEPGARAPVVLDLATGTGDLALGTARLAPHAEVIALDISRPMLQRAAARARAELPALPGKGGRVHFIAASIADIPLQDASVDLVTAGYGLRNAPRLEAALDEIARVLRPGGRLVTLDFFRPPGRLWRELFLGYLALAGWVYGRIWHGRPDAYVYIPRSIRRFVTAPGYERALGERGMHVRHARRHLIGGVAVHVATRSN